MIFSHLNQMIQRYSHIWMLYNEAEERWRLVYMYVCVCVCMYLFVKAKLIKGRQACVVKLWSQLGHGTAISQQIVCARSHFFFSKMDLLISQALHQPAWGYNGVPPTHCFHFRLSSNMLSFPFSAALPPPTTFHFKWAKKQTLNPENQHI